MTRPVIIAAVAADGVIGKDNKLLWHLSTDLQRFKRLTLGHSIIMGRNTYESIGKPLPGRTTIVLSRKNREIKGVYSANSIERALELGRTLSEKSFIAGGEQIYKAAMHLCDEMLLTHVDYSVEGDAFFPEIDEEKWKVYFEQKPEQGPRDAHPFSFRNYRRIR